MGQTLPHTRNPPLQIEQRDIFESRHVQRIKDTPFIDAVLYSSSPPLFVDPMSTTLLQLVTPRLGTQQHFPEQEVLNLMDSVVTGLAELTENGFAGHGDVCALTVGYSSKERVFKLGHPIFNEESGYLLTKHGKRFTSLSPEQLSALSEDSQESQVGVKSDIFAFGILLCEACSLSPSSDIYCPDTYSIFHLEIQKRLKVVEKCYSGKVVAFIEMCLEYDPDIRPGTQELAQFLQDSSIQESSEMQTAGGLGRQ